MQNPGNQYSYVKPAGMFTAFTRYAQFSGRASRREYWLWQIFTNIVYAVLGALTFVGIVSEEMSVFAVGMILIVVFALGTIVPNIAVTVRRLHDIGKSGGWWFIQLVPCIGGLWMLILMCQAGEVYENFYGPRPEDGEPDAVWIIVVGIISSFFVQIAMNIASNLMQQGEL